MYLLYIVSQETDPGFSVGQGSANLRLYQNYMKPCPSFDPPMDTIQFRKFVHKQEYIPVGCILPAAVAVWGCVWPAQVLREWVSAQGEGVSAQGVYTPLWTEWLTDRCKNITLPQTSFAGGKNMDLTPLCIGVQDTRDRQLVKLCLSVDPVLFKMLQDSPVSGNQNHLKREGTKQKVWQVEE